IADRDALDRLRADAGAHGWRELFSDRYPHAGGEGQTAWYAENPGGFEVEVVATTPTACPSPQGRRRWRGRPGRSAAGPHDRAEARHDRTTVRQLSRTGQPVPLRAW